jgi:HEAT repeat protein
MRHQFVLLSGILLALCRVFPLHAAESQDAAGQDYRAAYKLVLDGKYPEAIQGLQSFLAKHGSSGWADDARFWICFAMEKTESSPEKSFDCYERFVQANLKSEWVDDAQMNMVRIAHELARQGKPQYEEKVRSFAESDEGEIEMAVLAALLDMGDEASLSRVLERVDRTRNEEVRARMVRTLGDHGDSPAVVRKLSEMARKDPSPRVRESAIRALADTDSREAFEVLRDTALSGDSVELRKRAIRSLSDMDEHQAEVLPILKSVAEKDTDSELAMMAVRALGDIESREAVAALQGIYTQATAPEVRRAVVQAITDIDEAAKDAIPFLLKVASSDSSAEIRRSAVSALADLETPEALAALKELATSNHEIAIREAALRALGDYSGEQSIEALGAVLKSEKDARLRKAAVRALGDTEQDRAVPHLEQVAKTDPDPELRKAAVRALSEIGTPAARDALIRILEAK